MSELAASGAQKHGSVLRLPVCYLGCPKRDPNLDNRPSKYLAPCGVGNFGGIPLRIP